MKRVLLARGVAVEGERTYGTAVHVNFRGITKIIRALNLSHPSGEKRIPLWYLMAPVADRIALFQGLMDGDGTISATGNKLGYCSTNRELAQDVRTLVEGLGGIATLHTYDRSHENKPTDYLVSMRLPAGIVPFNVESRASRYVPGKRTHPSRRVERVEYSRDVESVCIQVDAPDQLYVTEHCILTHNTAISLCRILVADLYPAVVIAPASAARPVWFEAQLPMWLPGVTKHLVDSTHAWIPPAGWRGVVVTTWDLLRYHSTGLRALRPKLVVADEIHNALNAESQRTQHLRVLIDRVPHLHWLSGTPLVNRSQDLYQLLHLLDPKAWPEETLSLFRELNRDDFDRGVQTRLTRRISQFMLRRDKKEALPHLKVKQQSLVHVDLDPAVLAAYKRIERNFATWLERRVRAVLARERPDLAGEELEAEVDQRCLASLKAENLTRFGYLCRRVGMAKVPAAVAWIRGAVRAQEPVVVFTRHTDVLQAIVLALRQHGVRVSVVDGAVSPSRRGKTVKDFQEGRTDVFVASMAAKEALTLTRARHVLFAERWLTFAAEDQGADRIHRLGQLRDCFVWQLIARHTVDERLDTLVNRKKRISRRTVDGGRPQGATSPRVTTAPP